MSAQQQFDRKTIVVLCGGKSAEAEVSLISGRAVSAALDAMGLRNERIELEEDRLPPGLDSRTTLVFPAMHGGYGEGGALQRDLDALGVFYVGSGAQASELCMDKVATKTRVGTASGFHLAPSVAFCAGKPRPAAMLWAALTQGGQGTPTACAKAIAKATEATAANAACTDADAGTDANAEAGAIAPAQADMRAVLKPRHGGSSVGLFLPDSVAELERVLDSLPEGEWLLEQRVSGREMTVGILDGRAQAIVEIVPEGGVYDFSRKYRAGSTRYLYPAPLEPVLAQRICQSAERAFAACGCRDFARVDFILDGGDRAFFLEINTLPGLTPTSLLPKSASVGGLDFNGLIGRMLRPALLRSGWSEQEVLKD